MTAHPEGLGQLRETRVADAAGGNAHRRRPKRIRFGEEVKVRRSPQAAACRKRDGKARGRPHRLLGVGSVGGWYTAIEARTGKPGNSTRPEPQRRRGTRVGQAEESGDRESPPDARGESSHASYSERGKATDTGTDVTEGRSPHRPRAPDTVGPEARQPTALRGRADKANADKQHRCRDLYGGLNGEFLLAGWSDLNTEAASGVDGVTWQGDAEHRQANVEARVERLQQKRYRAKWMRRRDIAKGNGQERPLGMPVIEDKRLQAACARLLKAIDAQECLGCSDGYRPGRGAGEAIRDLTVDLQDGRYG